MSRDLHDLSGRIGYTKKNADVDGGKVYLRSAWRKGLGRSIVG